MKKIPFAVCHLATIGDVASAWRSRKKRETGFTLLFDRRRPKKHSRCCVFKESPECDLRMNFFRVHGTGPPSLPVSISLQVSKRKKNNQISLRYITHLQEIIFLFLPVHPTAYLTFNGYICSEKKKKRGPVEQFHIRFFYVAMHQNPRSFFSSANIS